jgi:hypothetical protein
MERRAPRLNPATLLAQTNRTLEVLWLMADTTSGNRFRAGARFPLVFPCTAWAGSDSNGRAPGPLRRDLDASFRPISVHPWLQGNGNGANLQEGRCVRGVRTTLEPRCGPPASLNRASGHHPLGRDVTTSLGRRALPPEDPEYRTHSTEQPLDHQHTPVMDLHLAKTIQQGQVLRPGLRRGSCPRRPASV